MNKLIRLVALLWLLPLGAFAGDGPVMEIGVTGMVCEFCSAKVERELWTLPGVASVAVDLEAKRARLVMVDGQQPDETTVRKLISAAGFTPGELKSPLGSIP